MKKIITHLMVLLTLVGLSTIQLNAQTTRPATTKPMMKKTAVDLMSSNIGWKAYKVGGSHEGMLKLKSADLDYADGILKGGSFTIDMASISVTDLEGEWRDKLVGHLKSPDFFSVEEFPTATFTITNVFSRGANGDYKIVGDLQLKGITKEVKFNALFNNGVATADLELDRTDFEIKYGSSTFLGNLGDKTIYDEFELTINLVTK